MRPLFRLLAAATITVPLALFSACTGTESGPAPTVLNQQYTSGDADFGSQLTSIRDFAPDVIFIPGYYTEAGNIAIQARKLGITAPLIGGDGWDSSQLAVIGKDAIEGAYYSNHYSHQESRPAVKKFVDAYKAAHNGETPDGLAALGYDAAGLLFDAMKRSPSLGGKDLAKAIADTKGYAGVTGDITMDANRDAVKPAVIVKMQGGEPVYVKKIYPGGMAPPPETTPPTAPPADGAPPVAPTPAPEGNEILIGEYGSMTGSEATFGQSTHNGILLAVDEINAAGGVNGRRIKLINYDDQGKPQEAGTAVTRLINDDHVVAVLGEVASGLSIAGGRVAQQYNVPMISPSSTNPAVTEIGDMVSRVCFLDSFQGDAVARFSVDDLHAKKAAILYANDSPYSKGLAEYFQQSFEKMTAGDKPTEKPATP
jgi:ABC-type branched-subunit amino acid transport system substrate-binding protein